MDNKMMNDIYADGIGNVRLAGTNVRIDLLVVGDQPDKDGKPAMQKKAELIMPLSGLIRANTQIQNVLDQLTEKGVLKKKDSEDVEKTQSQDQARKDLQVELKGFKNYLTACIR